MINHHVLLDRSPIFSSANFCEAWEEFGILEAYFHATEDKRVLDFVTTAL